MGVVDRLLRIRNGAEFGEQKGLEGLERKATDVSGASRRNAVHV